MNNMKKNNAFTLIELIVIIIIIGVILLFALPNVTSTLERNKKDAMIEDAKDFIDKTRNYLTIHSISDSSSFTLDVIDTKNEIKKSPYGKDYDRSSSFVTVKIINDDNILHYEYTVTLIDNGGHKIEDASLNNLNSKDKYGEITS